MTVGLIVNPKLKTPVGLARQGGDYRYEIFRLDTEEWDYEGRGYLDTDDPAAYVTGMPRTHTPDGIETEGMGFGTCLYTALCVGSHIVNHADGVSSRPGNRSYEAERWWDNAVQLGLADRDLHTETEELVNATDELGRGLIGDEVEEGVVTYVNEVNVDVERNVEADTYSYNAADEADLILCTFTREIYKLLVPSSPMDLWKIVLELGDKALTNAQPDLILALDVRECPLATINLLGVVAQLGGASEEDLDAFRLRWESKLDPSAQLKQMRLPGLTPNQRRAAVIAVERAAELRAQTPWDTLAVLP